MRSELLPAPDALALACGRLIGEAQAERRLPSVVAAVLRDAEPRWEEAVGLADLERGEDATPDHQYRIASITKTFTAAAVMQLRDEGRIDLDDPLEQHVPGLRRQPRLRRLLSHSSGIQRETPGSDWEYAQLPSAEEVMERLDEVEYTLEPGDEWHYSNLAFVLLGEVVQRLSGMPYERYVEERLLEPVGLRRTSWAAAPPAATGYYVHPWADTAEVQPLLEGARAAGALWSTVADLCRWGSFLCDPDPDVLRPETAEEMHRFQTMMDLERWTLGWGLGLMLYRRGDRIFAGHSGGHAGFLSNLAWDRGSRTVAAVVTNSGAGVPIETLCVDLLAAALDAEPAEPPEWRAGESVPAELEGVLGRWFSEGAEFVFRFREGKLQAASEGGRSAPAVFEREGEDLYRTISGRERGEELRIVRDDGDVVVKLYWATYPFTREPRAF